MKIFKFDYQPIWEWGQVPHKGIVVEKNLFIAQSLFVKKFNIPSKQQKNISHEEFEMDKRVEVYV